LTRGRRPVVENDDYAEFARRVIRSHGRRVAGGDVDGLAALLGSRSRSTRPPTTR